MASPEMPNSPASSVGSLSDSPPTLEQLVSHFVAAKRSLASTQHVWRANEIVNTARALLEENATFSAKNAFIRSAVREQLHALDAVREGVEQVGRDGQKEFKTLLQTLDAHSARLQGTLQTLQSTPVEPAFQPPETPPKYLFDFVNENDVNELNSALRHCIDRTNAATAALVDTTEVFDRSLESIQVALTSVPAADDAGVSPLPSSFRAQEGHATEMANLLESLVRHYDLCVTALKHTEGGGEAAALATGELPANLDINVESLHQDAPPQPITEEERTNMLLVVGKDAAEVEEVVGEIRDGLVEMEGVLAETTTYIEQLRAENAGLRSVVSLLGKVGGQMPGYISAASEYMARWDEERSNIEEKMEQLEGLRQFYEGFLGAYDGLLVEVGRRRGVQNAMEKIAQEAMAKIEKLFKEDADQRELFKEDQGDFLPSDIWPGLVNPPVRFEVRAIDGAGSIPEVKKEVLEKAFQRVRSKV
ncbi:APG17-domain-containing protein [Patellaria atrata CBS 101060]|uniref:Autophagy-related protein 17 n=1 Tax=Patellaria atrata CBS 101060 TaxID=1346257 RepID=A0A9P4S3R9_9PEZI|nr:APG17-domain-containing protein [Patellaria atrata CBS 101060]